MSTPVYMTRYNNHEARSKPILPSFLVSLHPIGLFLSKFSSDITCFHPQVTSHAFKVCDTGKTILYCVHLLESIDPLFLGDPFLEHTTVLK